MFAVRHHPELVTPALWSLLRPLVRYDADGRCSAWLLENTPLPPLLGGVARAVCPGVTFAAVLLQCYRDGLAVTPCHTDLGSTGPGFILSLGAARTFRIHRFAPGTVGCVDPSLDAMTVECVEGTAIVMGEAFHENWHHQIAADPGVTGEKLSLVFRTRPGG